MDMVDIVDMADQQAGGYGGYGYGGYCGLGSCLGGGMPAPTLAALRAGAEGSLRCCLGFGRESVCAVAAQCVPRDQCCSGPVLYLVLSSRYTKLAEAAMDLGWDARLVQALASI